MSDLYTDLVKEGAKRPRLDWIVANELSADWRYQRKISPSQVERIVSGFNPDHFGTLIISHRKNGSYVILDGQHRVEAIHKLGWADDQKLPCLVHEGLTLEEEAAIFAGSNNSKALAPIDKFRARIVAKEEKALAIQKAVEDAGFMLVLNSHNKSIVENGLTCVSGLELIYDQNGGAFLALVMNVIRVAWGYEPTSRQRDIIEGVWRFMRWYAEEPNFNRDIFVAKLKSVSPVKLVRDAAALREALGSQDFKTPGHAGRNAVALAQLLVRLYNSGLRVNKHLPAWHDKESIALLPKRQAAGKKARSSHFKSGVNPLASAAKVK